MKTHFREPDFITKELECRFEHGTVCLYGTEEGLRRIMDLCRDLIDHPEQGHVHLENYDLLTKESTKCAIAIFPKARS